MGSILVLFAGVIYQIEVKDKREALDRLLLDRTQIMAASVHYNVHQIKLRWILPIFLYWEVVLTHWLKR
jgi:hypothetical protein